MTQLNLFNEKKNVIKPPERLAKCCYSRDGIGGQRRKSNCSPCEGLRPSHTRLAFFKSRPLEQYDEYYCGCFGWD